MACGGFEEHLGTSVCRGQLAGLTCHLSAVKSDHAGLTVYPFHKRGQVGREPGMVAQIASGQQGSSVLAEARWPGWVLDSMAQSECFPVWGFCDDVISFKPGDGVKHKILVGCQL